MMKHNRITRSLCAAMLALCLLPCAMLRPAQASPSPDDVYAIDVEFGNLSFYYDYGTWNVNTMRYEASAASTYPAEGTDAGFPGWYGFDDIANRISIKNISQGKRAVTLSLYYRALDDTEWDDAGVAGSVSGVNMTVTTANDSSVLWNGNSVTVPAEKTAVGCIHLAGEPRFAGEAYTSATMQPIGMLTLKIEAWTP